ncbi:MAG TPA: rhodanese-like domain-containing protein [Candidatus Saccharimonadales bacterium]|nr:rhodanese-like domain-containing protein [Candidatus Saccharimonadales bacterium]
MILEQHYLGCLSQASYLVADEASGEAAIVDPRRDVDEYVETAAARGLAIRHILLTHFHADFASGHLELSRKTGAPIYLGAPAKADYPFVPLADGQSIDLGGVRIQALATPGHTPESTSFAVFDLTESAESPRAVLTGDTLFVGDVGRPDLMASAGISAEDLAGSLYDSLHTKLLALPDETIVYPGHGAGSACGKNLGSETSSTIGQQRRMNYALQPMEREAFIRIVTSGLPEPPRYFGHDARLNRENHPGLEEIVSRSLRPLSIEEVLDLSRAGARILDARQPEAFAAGHIAGSINVGLEGRFASWAGTILDPEAPLVIVADPGREKEAIVRLGRIGLDRVEGFLDGGIASLNGHAGALASFRRYAPGELAASLASGTAPVVLDIRGDAERAAGHLAGSLHVPLPSLQERMEEVPQDREVVVTCAQGYRSAIAVSLLRAGGHGNVSDLSGGFNAWKAAGHPTVTGAPESSVT